MFHGVVCSRLKGYLFYIFLLKSSNGFFEKLMFSKGPSFFVNFVCNYEALNLRPHVVDLLSSLTMSWPAKITSKLNMSGLDFLVPVLQSSNSFDRNAFFQVLFSLSRTVCRGNDNLLLSESLRSTVFLCKVENLFSVLFFGLKLQTLSPLNSYLGRFYLGRWSFQMLRVYWRRKRCPYFSDIPALKFGRYFTAIGAKTAAAIFPVKRRYFFGSTPLTPLFFRFKAATFR